MPLLRDVRTYRGHIWNVADVLHRFSVGSRKSPWNRKTPADQPAWIDQFVYEGFRAHGSSFLRFLAGRFAVAFHDEERGTVFLARDWIGEAPMHTLATANALIVGNTIADLKEAAGPEYAYAYVRSFPQSYLQEIDLGHVDPRCVALTMRPDQPTLYFDFERAVREQNEEAAHEPDGAWESLSRHLSRSVRRRVGESGEPHAVLLSGGLDSFTVALMMRCLGLPIVAYTLNVGRGGGDVRKAAEFAKLLRIPHHVLEFDAAEVVAAFPDAVRISESYHLFNVYCAVGMLLMGRRLEALGVRSAFCGEAVNEAVGDYHDWAVTDPRTGTPVLLQRVDHKRLGQSSERALYVWGHPLDRGKYNRQLGTGLAKHAGARMIKPFAHCGITLECPYYEPHLLARLAAIPPEALAELGGKPGLVARAFAPELARFGVDTSVVLSSAKVRLQDASEDGEGGLTPILLQAGCDQRRAIEAFNEQFGASLDPELDSRRLGSTS